MLEQPLDIPLEIQQASPQHLEIFAGVPHLELIDVAVVSTTEPAAAVDLHPLLRSITRSARASSDGGTLSVASVVLVGGVTAVEVDAPASSPAGRSVLAEPALEVLA